MDHCQHCHGYRHAMPVRTDTGVVHVSLCRCDRLKCGYCEQAIGPVAKSCSTPLPPWPGR